ncbi:hypothetical protein ABFG93_11880 [Pseudalkalibacillus hwajinpoensis]|uniref:hypothetical protein n=1 Tax=Guptibacillus hwajinpoensis TaxID=208199 RepID=UPI00325BD770
MARLNPQAVGAHEDETLFVSTEGAKQTKDLATAARHEKRRRAFRNAAIGTRELEHVLCVSVLDPLFPLFSEKPLQGLHRINNRE